MSTLTKEMKDLIATQQCFVGTVGENDMPNISPKRSTRVIADDSLTFIEVTGGLTFQNIKRGSKVVVAVVNRDTMDGFRFLGNPEIQESGELYDQAADMLAKMGRPKPYAVVVIKVTEIHSLKPGNMAGKKVG
jgi:uncharacterized protein